MDISVQLVKREYRTKESYAWFTCPDCGIRGKIDRDQFEGQVSIMCEDECGFHKTIDMRTGLG